MPEESFILHFLGSREGCDCQLLAYSSINQVALAFNNFNFVFKETGGIL
jgi:hypothetical protein